MSTVSLWTPQALSSLDTGEDSDVPTPHNDPDTAVRLYTVAELAKLWAVSREYVYEEIREKRLPAIQLGNRDRNKLRVSATDAAAWIKRHRAASETGT